MNQALSTTGLGPSGVHPHALRPHWSARSACILTGHIPSLDIPCGYHILASIRLGVRLSEMAWSFWKDKRPEWIQAEERAFVKAANALKTLQVTPRGGMRIDPEEIRDQILAARELYKDLVEK